MSNLPHFYLITPSFQGVLYDYLKALENSLQQGIRLIQLRSKQLSFSEYVNLAKEVSKLVYQYEGKLILNGSTELLNEIHACGIHFPSADHLMFHHKPFDASYLMSVACHNEEQLAHAKKINADIVLLSPICATPSSPQGIPIGWEKFARMIKNYSLPVYALGGLTVQDYLKAQKLGAHGIASIRAFWNLDHSLHQLSSYAPNSFEKGCYVKKREIPAF